MFYNKLIRFSLLFFVLNSINIVKTQDFSYEGILGPEHWGEQYHTCDGKYQSPINIDILKVKKTKFPPLKFISFDQIPSSSVMLNNGHTVMIRMEFQESPKISGGPLNNTYIFEQLHYHWGDNDTVGSEDLINNQSFPAELHMVFYNTKYYDFHEATKNPDGLVVLAFFYELTTDENEYYLEISSLVETIIEPNTKAILINPPAMKNLISKNLKQYYTYYGSLTTPPCSEIVQWIDFAVPIPITSEQIKNFRYIKTHESSLLTHNFRPIQPLNDRIIYYQKGSSIKLHINRLLIILSIFFLFN